MLNKQKGCNIFKISNSDMHVKNGLLLDLVYILRYLVKFNKTFVVRPYQG